MNYEIINEEYGYALIRSPYAHDEGTVVRIRRDHGQVMSALPCDLMPAYGGIRFGRLTNPGVEYVSSWITLTHARRVFRRLVTEAKEVHDAMSNG